MRTTLDIDREVLNAVKDIAKRNRMSAGAVLSDLARQALTKDSTCAPGAEPEPFLGFEPFAAGGRVVSDDTVEQLRDEEGI